MRFNELFNTSTDLIVKYNNCRKENRAGIKFIAEARKQLIHSKDGSTNYWDLIIREIENDIANNSEPLFRADVKEKINFFLECYFIACEHTEDEKLKELQKTFQTALNVANWYRTIEIKENRFSTKIKALFQFIEYLHSNIDKFNCYNGLIKELKLLKVEKNKLKPEQNYKDRLDYEKLKEEIGSKFKTLQDNTAKLIKAKAKELVVCSFDKEPIYSWYGIESEIQQLKKNIRNKDLPEIFKHKNQYLKYRANTHKTFLSLQLFFDELDEITKSLFDYFKETEQNEYEPFETESVDVASIREATKILAENNGKPLKVNITGFNIEKGEGNIFKNMPVIENHYLPLIDNLKKAINNNEIPTKDIGSNWQSLRIEIESDLYSISKFYNVETIDFCEKRIFPLIDNEIRKTEQIIPSQPIKTKADILKENLQKGGFYNLEKVIRLSKAGQRELIKLLSENKMPYGIAMFDYLRFCTFLDEEKGTKVKANFYLSRLYNEKAKDGTRSRHLRNSLINNKPRHTSYLHIENTIKDYEKLK